MTSPRIDCMDALDFVRSLDDNSVDLICTDPPYHGIIAAGWDRKFKHDSDFAQWLAEIFIAALPKLTANGSLVFFGAIGSHESRPLFKTMMMLEAHSDAAKSVSPDPQPGYLYRNLLTWKKRRAYGKSHDYLFCREEIAWYSKSAERTGVIFNVPYLEEKRGYDGFDKAHPAKSEFKRVSNVLAHIPELMRPEREGEKPLPLMDLLVNTHSNPGSLIVDPFCGLGTTGVAAIANGRRFAGCDTDPIAAFRAIDRCKDAERIVIESAAACATIG